MVDHCSPDHAAAFVDAGLWAKRCVIRRVIIMATACHGVASFRSVLICNGSGTSNFSLKPILLSEISPTRKHESAIPIACAGLPRCRFGRHDGGAESGEGGDGVRCASI